MTRQIHPEAHEQPKPKAVPSYGLSMMAVQEKLGLFTGHQEHAGRTTAEPGQPTTDLQHALQENPLSYV